MTLSRSASAPPRRGRRAWRVALAGAATGVLLLFGGGTAGAAAPSDQDVDYITSNGQTNLAEIALSDLVLERSSNPQARELATMTGTDHRAALAKLTPIAATLGVSLPTAPSPAQQADAARLESSSDADFDLVYANIQVAGHRMSIAGTETEIDAGSEQSLLDYASGYLPVASHHLDMAESLLTSLGGTPSSVPAGTGGLAAQTQTPAEVLGLVAGGVLLLAAGTVLLVRRRAAR